MKNEYGKPALEYAALLFRKLAFWRKEPPIVDPADLARFVETRSKFIAQTTLYGYLRTRAGTRYPSLFEDELFAHSLEIAKWQIYLACLSDLMVYTVGLTVSRTDAAAQGSAIAERLMDDILADDIEILTRLVDGYDGAREKIAIRLRNTPWPSVEDGEGPFESSQNALVEWAPVAPQLKEFDTEIVINSMRFKWKGVRDEFRERLDAERVIAGWQDRAA